MGKICLNRPQSTGTLLYGSLRKHRGYVTIKIELGGAGDHVRSLGDEGDDLGFKGAHESRVMRVEGIYNKNKPGMDRADEKDPKTGKWKIGEFMGNRLVEAPELTEQDRHRTIVEVAMSFEQFAEMITSNGHLVDCTVEHIGVIGKPGNRYREQVTPPAPIYDRAQRRMEKAQQEALAKIDEALEMHASAKVKHALRMARQHVVANSAFVVQQAAEELSAVAEGAVSIIADKVMALEAEGRLPEGTYHKFTTGQDDMGLLLGSGEDEPQ